MKKLFISAVILLMLTSCGKTVSQPKYPIVIDTAVKVVFQNTDYEADVVSTADGIVTALMTMPSELKGLKLIIDGETVTVEKDDIKLDYQTEALNNSPFLLLSKVIRELNTQQPIFSDSGEEMTVSFDADNSRVQVRFDPNQNNVTYISTKECSFEFYNGGD